MLTETRQDPTTDIGHSIKYVAKRTGLSTHVIRIWERRYNAITPVRTPTNRRLYTETDIERLVLLNQAIKAGHAIGQIAQLETSVLIELAKKDAQPPLPPISSTPTPPPTDESPTDTPQAYVDRCITAIKALDASRLENELGRAAVAFSQVKLMTQVIEPLMHYIGNAWEKGHIRIADEHLASSVVRNFVNKLQSAYNKEVSGPSILVTTPAGQRHEIGALLVANAAASAGWNTVYVGPDLPANEIASAAQRKNVKAVALSIIYPADDPQLGEELRDLRQALGPDMPILMGGRGTTGYMNYLNAIGALHLSTLDDLKSHLENLRVPSITHPPHSS